MDLKIAFVFILPALIVSSFLVFEPRAQEPIFPEAALSEFLTIEKNSLIANSPLPSPRVVKRIKVVATAYSSTPQQTDDEPFITAAGTRVRDGIIANNLLPFGTKIRIPELYGEKVFVVEDRMHWRKGDYQIDIWFPSYWEAKNFGAKRIYMEILEGRLN